MSRAPRDVVFDLGAVVLHWDPVSLLMDQLAPHAPTVEAARALAQGIFQGFEEGGDWAEFDRGSYDTDGLSERVARRLGLPVDDLRHLVGAIPAHLQIRADTASLIAELAGEGARLLFLSNMPRPLKAHAQSCIDRLGVFEGGLFSCDVGLVKPEPAIFDLMARRHGLHPPRTVFFDDNAKNIAAARALGWQAFAYVDAASARRDLGR